MKTPRIANAVGHIDDDLIIAAAENRKKTKHNHWLQWGSAAACFAVLIITGAAILPSLFSGNVSPNGTDGRYKDFNIQAGESAIIWPWEYQTVYERYTGLSFDGTEYRGKGSDISEDLVGELIGTHTIVGYDEITGEKHTSDFEVYGLKYVDKSQCVTVKMDGIYYVFMNDTYAPPSTLGNLFDLVDFPKAVELNRFSEEGDSLCEKYFALNDDEFIWKILADCKDAAFVEDDPWTAEGREYINFTVTSETLGVYKGAMYVTTDGYLWTNAFDWQYLFNIGKDAAGEIIKYAKENSEEAPYEPYRNSISGRIVEITDDHILVDDSILCKDPADGITYKILINDIRISRYIDNDVISVNDIIQITYEGEIAGKHSNTIDSAIFITKVVIYDGDAFILE